MKKPLTIGKVAELSGVNVETIRYYQRFGIISEPPKPAEGYRHYPTDTITRIRFIKRAKQLGFSLKEIQGLLALGDSHCGDIMQHAKQKRAHIQQQINDLGNLLKNLDELITSCGSDKQSPRCPIVEALTSQ